MAMTLCNSNTRVLNSAESFIVQVTRELRSILPFVARLCIILYFVQDAISVFINWDVYMSAFNGKPTNALVVVYLLLAVLVETIGSIAILFRYHASFGCAILIGLLLSQIVVGILNAWGIRFIAHYAGCISGLSLLLAENVSLNRDPLNINPAPANGLLKRVVVPLLQLGGRNLLNLMFISIWFEKNVPGLDFHKWIAYFLMIPISIGYRAKLCSAILVFWLAGWSLYMHQFWKHPNDGEAIYTRMDFYNNFSIIGALLLVVLIGPGDMSVDALRRKRE